MRMSGLGSKFAVREVCEGLESTSTSRLPWLVVFFFFFGRSV